MNKTYFQNVCNKSVTIGNFWQNKQPLHNAYYISNSRIDKTIESNAGKWLVSRRETQPFNFHWPFSVRFDCEILLNSYQLYCLHTLMNSLALLRSPSVVWRELSPPTGTISFNFSRQFLRWARRFFSSSLWVDLKGSNIL